MTASPIPRSGAPETLLGMASIGIWSSLIAVSRVLSEEIGPFRAASWSFAVSAIVGLVLVIGRQGGFGEASRLSRKYFWGCGALFVTCILSLYLAVGLAETRREVVTAGLINYLWPSLTLLLSVPLIGARARWRWLIPGIVIAGGGVFMAMGRGSGFALKDIAAEIALHPLSPFLALIAALSWALYSNLARRWNSGSEVSGAPLFLIATAPAIWLVRMVTPAEVETDWTTGALWRLAYVGILGNGLGYVFWDIAVRRGRMLLLASLSYLIPLFSTIISCLMLGEHMSWPLWAACGLVIGGAAICRAGLTEE